MSNRPFVRKTIKRGCNLVVLAVFILFIGPVSTATATEDYPSRTINLIMGFSPGGGVWNTAQIFAENAKKYFPKPQPIIVVSKPGAGSAIAADYVLKRRPDGYTLHWMSWDLPQKLAKEGQNLAFKMEDFIQIGNMFVSPHILLVNKENSPFKTLEDFVDYAKKHPGELSFGSTGVGGSVHLSTEVLMLRTGIKMNQVPFAGAARAVTALLGGHVDCIITSPSTAGDHIKPGGGLRVLVSLATPLPGLPDVPTCQEKGYNVNRAFWASLAAPARTPKPILDILSDTFNKTANDPNVKEALTKLGTLPVFWDAEATEKKAKEDFDSAKEVFKKLGML